ncbi:hypothetical protein COU74_01330 [Candidatus Peregrinibacteria bacterium CG10_big_fil_rev_8_21_14_0_10_36_19]|nr:MAG: hypothetical protein COU74_01330 [Candidatus Peregrinibacteria bacterium CG10_big_fil_rev_8_21_14_0_10_36_19]
MEVSYNLRYKKSNFSNKLLIDKEGEVIIYSKGFRLKGKGAADKGELINFSEIKEFYYRDEEIIFVTFNKEKYVLCDSGSMFNNLLVDIYKARNEFLVDALFMKGGKLKAEFEGEFQRLSKFAKLINKGKAKFKLYEKGIVIVPETQDAFSLHYDFVNFHEFDEMEYSLKIVMDDGVNVFFSKLGNDFEFFQERLNELLGGMYETLVNETFREAFGYFNAVTLLKLAYKMRGGKGVSLKDIKKMDADLAKEVEEFIFKDEIAKEKLSYLAGMTDEYSTFYGIAKDKTVEGSFIKWVMYAIPAKNTVAISILPRWVEGQGENTEQHETYFYKIIIEQGDPAQKVEDKIQEMNQALLVLNFAKDPCYKDKRELKHSPYQYAIRKLPYLRILRKSFVGKVASADVKEWKKQVDEILPKAILK